MGQQKKLLFVCYGLGIGGIERCLVNLLNILPEDEFDVDLLVLNPEYALKDQIRRKVNFLDAFSYIYNTEFTMGEIRRRGGLWKYRRMLLPYLDHRVRIKLGLPLWTTFRPLEKHYDVAVAYSQNGLAPYYVADKVTANRKVLWYHNGAYEKKGKDYALDQRYYSRFDDVVAVSRYCAEMLREKFPGLEGKITVLRNICDREHVLRGSEAFIPGGFSGDAAQIVTVGRLAPEKGPELALEACRLLREEGRKIVWHWVGDGPMMKTIRAQAEQMGLGDCFRLEGDQVNPYPFMKYAKIYVQPSRYEAYSTTVTEARVLLKPIVTTAVGGMEDQLTDGITGRIVPISAQALAEVIGQLLDSEETARRYSDNLQQEVIGGGQELEAYRKTVFA